MRWFYLLILSVAVAGGALAIERIADVHESLYLKIITAAALIGIFVSFLGFLTKIRE